MKSSAGFPACATLSAAEPVLVLLWRKTGGMAESNPEAVRALIAAALGDFLQLQSGLSQEAFRIFNTHPMKFSARRSTKAISKRLVQTAPGHRRDPGKVIHADGL